MGRAAQPPRTRATDHISPPRQPPRNQPLPGAVWGLCPSSPAAGEARWAGSVVATPAGAAWKWSLAFGDFAVSVSRTRPVGWPGAGGPEMFAEWTLLGGLCPGTLGGMYVVAPGVGLRTGTGAGQSGPHAGHRGPVTPLGLSWQDHGRGLCCNCQLARGGKFTPMWWPGRGCGRADCPIVRGDWEEVDDARTAWGRSMDSEGPLGSPLTPDLVKDLPECCTEPELGETRRVWGARRGLGQGGRSSPTFECVLDLGPQGPYL